MYQGGLKVKNVSNVDHSKYRYAHQHHPTTIIISCNTILITIILTTFTIITTIIIMINMIGTPYLFLGCSLDIFFTLKPP